jgi:hypothetical protein
MRPTSPPVLRLDHALGALAAVLGALTVLPWLPLNAADHVPAISRDPPLFRTALELPPLSSFAALVERPLFTPSRRANAADRQAAGAGFAGRYRLLGLVAAGEQRSALLADGPRVIELREGDAIAGWTIKRIEQDRLVLSSAAGEAVLTLPQATGTPAPPAVSSAK